jgi:hypothetical protein
MSRYEIPAKDEFYYKVIVGWDPPLLTFFVEVIDRAKDKARDDERRIVFWAGTSLREIYEVEQLASKVSRFAHLSDEMRRILYRDKDEWR